MPFLFTVSYKLAVAAVDAHTDVSRLYRLDRLPSLFALNRERFDQKLADWN